MYSNRSFGYLLPTPSKSPRSSKKMCCQIPDGFKVDRKVHGCAIGVKGGSPSRSVRAHWLVVGAVAGWSPWLGGRNFFPRAVCQTSRRAILTQQAKAPGTNSMMPAVQWAVPRLVSPATTALLHRWTISIHCC